MGTSRNSCSHMLRAFPRRYLAPKLFVALSAVVGFSLSLPQAANVSAQQSAPTEQPQQQLLPSNQFVSISGHIFRADSGAPLAKAIVTLDRVGVNPDDQLVMRTASDGAYQFTDLEPGTYTLTAQRLGFTPYGYGQERIKTDGIAGTWVHLESGQSLSGLDMHLTAGCPPNICRAAVQNVAGTQAQKRWVISGNMRDEDGDPLDGGVSAVRVQYLQDGTILDFNEGSASADEQGNFQLTGTATGTFYLAATAIGARGNAYTTIYYPDALSFDSAQRFAVSPGTEVRDLHIVFRTLPTYSIRGKIVLTEGNAANQHYGVTIRSLGIDPTGWLRAGNPSIVRPDGSFVARGLQPGDYLLTVSEAKRETLDGNVYYTLSGLPRLGMAEIRVTNSDIQLTVPMSGATAIRGAVSLDGEPEVPLPGLRIELGVGRFLRLPMAMAAANRPIQRDGSFQIVGLGPGRYTLAVVGSLVDFNRPPPQAPNVQSVYIKRVECGGVDYTGKILAIGPSTPLGDCNITLAKNPGTVTGIVQDGNKPAPDSVVVLIPQSLELRRDPAYLLTGETDASGRFQIAKVIPGDYFVFAVPLDKDNGYFALNFAESNEANATRVTVHQNETANVPLQRFEPK